MYLENCTYSAPSHIVPPSLHSIENISYHPEPSFNIYPFTSGTCNIPKVKEFSFKCKYYPLFHFPFKPEIHVVPLCGHTYHNRKIYNFSRVHIIAYNLTYISHILFYKIYQTLPWTKNRIFLVLFTNVIIFVKLHDNICTPRTFSSQYSSTAWIFGN